MILKKTNLFLLLLLSNSFAFSGETAKAMEEESDDEDLMAEVMKKPEARYIGASTSKQQVDACVDDNDELTTLFRKSCSVTLPGSDADKERRSSDSLRASTSADRMHEERYKENIQARDNLAAAAAADSSFTSFPRQLSGQKRGLTPHPEVDDTSDNSAPSSVQSSPQRPKPVKGRVANQKKRRLNSTETDNNNDQDMATS